MKKKVLYVFTLVLYLLLVCTLVSQKIEAEMQTQAEVSERRFVGRMSAPFSASKDTLFADEDGLHLYEVVEGRGWQNGTCAKEVSRETWSFSDEKRISIPNGRSYTIVESASRMPIEGSRIAVVKVPGRTKDYVPLTDLYLVCYTEGVPGDFALPENSKIAAKSDMALLLDMGDVIFPFFEHRAKQLSDSMEYEECRVFSMTEIGIFLEQLPRVAALGIYIVLPIWLWICSGMMIKEHTKYKDLLLMNAGITMIFLLCGVRMLEQIDFPASLMPTDNIFDLSHYLREVGMIIEAQNSLKINGRSVAVLLAEVKSVIMYISCVGMFIGFVLSGIEVFIVTRIRNVITESKDK